jgi:hypothetical protein
MTRMLRSADFSGYCYNCNRLIFDVSAVLCEKTLRFSAVKSFYRRVRKESAEIRGEELESMAVKSLW